MINIKRALISVTNKEHILPLAKSLMEKGTEIISTGGTHKFLSENGVNSIEISDFTGFPEILEGRVKTLHPKIFGGILSIPEKHKDEILSNNISCFDLIVCNLYPFQDTVNSGKSDDEIIENIDIGGVSLIRAAAKNYHYVCVVVDFKDYDLLKNGSTDLSFRKSMAAKAFKMIADYDNNISNYFNKDDYLNINCSKSFDFRYGENPHQSASFFSNSNFPLEQIQGKKLSYNNFLDSEMALQIISEFDNLPTSVIIKHNNPCGVAEGHSILSAYERSVSSDKLSSFGGVIAFNKIITKECAESLVENFVEVLIVPGVDDDAYSVLSRKNNLRVLIYDKISKNKDLFVRSCFNGFIVQEYDNFLYKDFIEVTNFKPSEKEKSDLIFAWKVCKHVKSNAIVLVKDQKTIGIGAGQMSRIDSLNISISKSCENVEGAVLASDAFFPFTDCIDVAHINGIKSIIQPGGSIRDSEVISESNKKGISMVFTNTRHFKH